MNEIYPEFNEESNYPLYYVEFDRGFSKDSFTLFKRSFIHTVEEWKKFDLSKDVMLGIMGREGHPYNLFDGFCKEGCVPDRKMIKFFVDAINEKVGKEKNGSI